MAQVEIYSAAITPTITVSTSPAYSANDVVGGKITITNAAPVEGGGARLRSFILLDKDNKTAANWTIWFFNADPSGSTVTDNGALGIVDADAAKLVGRLSIATADLVADAGAAWKVAPKTGLDLSMQCASGSRNLFMVMTMDGTPTYTATTDIQVILQFGPA